MPGVNKFLMALMIAALALLVSAEHALSQPAEPRTVTRLGDFSLSLGLVSNDVWLFELSPTPPDASRPYELSLMTMPQTKITRPSGGGDAWASETVKVRLSHNPPTITISRQDDSKILTLNPYAPDGQLSGICFNGDYDHLMGLGADNRTSGNALNLLGNNVTPATPFGNGRMTSFGSRPNQVQAPIVYGLGDGLECAALFVDETLPLQWSFTSLPWTVGPAGPLGPSLSFRFFVITGSDLADLRHKFMDLTGRPQVPPQKALGVWASGVQGNTETDWRDKVGSLKNSVPGLSGLMAENLNDLTARLEMAKLFGLRLMVDESAYISQSSPYYTDLAGRSFLVRQTQGGPIMLVSHDGQRSGLVDYTNAAAVTFWHSLQRQEQISSGISSFRLVDSDLPEASAEAWYEGPSGGQVHSHYAWANSYALKWVEGLTTAVRNQRVRGRSRLLILSRTGLPGLARLNASLYNGEASLFTNRSLLAIRGHLALSGFDYYSSDLSHNLSSRPVDQYAQMYDTWLAKSALTDIPLILPDELLTRPGARYNLALRESLNPYYYSLAWTAHLDGQPIIAPLAYYFQADSKARERVGELMIGPGLLMGLDFDGAAERAEVFVPAGRWYNWRTGEVLDQSESGPVSLDLKDAGQITPPLLARAGAIIPGQEEMSLKGGGSEKIDALKIFIGQESSEFVWYEDDGESLGYVVGNFGKTVISAVTKADGSTVVTIKAREGSWDGAPAERRLLVDIYGPKAPGEATLDNQPHNRVARLVELDQLDSGWASIGTNRIRFKTPPLDMNVDHILWFK